MDPFSPYLSDAELVATLSERLKQLRVSKRLTQEELAQRSGINKRFISKVESGNNFSIKTLIALMRPLNLIENLNLLLPEPDPTIKSLKEIKKENVIPQRVRKGKNE